MDPISLDKELADKLNAGMKSGEAIELPFPVIYAWALNGQASYKSQGGALYYGGWAAKVADAQALADQAGLEIPAGWKQATIASRDGGEFEAYTMRSLIVAPIAKRESWLLDGQRYPHYTEGGRRHVQVLVYLAEQVKTNGTAQFVPWSPVVLTAKGYQAKNLLQAFTAWDKATSAIRWKVAPGVPAWCFYLSLGTFGSERQAMNVGKPGAQSPITPISAYVPPQLTEELLGSLFVGGEVAALMAEYQGQARQWLDAWKEPLVEETPGEAGAGFGEPTPPDNWGADQDIPF